MGKLRMYQVRRLGAIPLSRVVTDSRPFPPLLELMDPETIPLVLPCLLQSHMPLIATSMKMFFSEGGNKDI